MRLNKKQTIFIGMAFMSICAFWQLYDGIVPLILKQTFDLNDTIAGVIMALDNVLALIMLPLFGMLSDKTKSRFGKRMPYIVMGTVFATVFMLILPIADNMNSFTLFAVGLGLVLVTMGTYRSPAVALMPDVTPKPFRSAGNAIINLMGAAGGIILLLAIAILVPKGEKPNYMPVFLFTAGFMVACIFVLVKTTNEVKLTEKMRIDSLKLGEYEEKDTERTGKLSGKRKVSLLLILSSVFLWFMGYNAVTTAFSKYANVYWKLEGGMYAYTLIIAQAAAIAAYIPAGIAAEKIGRKKTILIGIVFLSAAFLGASFYKSFSGMIFVFFIFAGIGWAGINVNSYPMVVEMSKGTDVGKYTGYYYTFSMLAQVLTPILSGAVLEYMGYKYLFPYAVVFVGMSFVTMLFVRHGESRPARKKSHLEAFDVGE